VTRPATIANGVVIALAVIAYGSTVNNYFIQDDFGVVWLLSQKPATYFPQWFVSTWMDNIWGYTPDEVRPFPAVSYQIAALFGAGVPFANHILNIAFHAGTALLVVQVALHAAGLGLPAATLAGIIFVLLPNQAESAAWITGRVDSMPALFYVASFVTYVRWQRSGGARLYAWSVFWCFVALLSKQTAITLGPAFVLYDVMVARRPIAFTWQWLRPYLPFAVLTMGYLGLRYVLFGEIARESSLTTERMNFFIENAANHMMRIVMGAEELGGIGGQAVAIAVAAFLLAWAVGAFRLGPEHPRYGWSALYFGIVWTALGILPTIVSTYISPRHAYLASLGWALAVGIAFDAMWRVRAKRVVSVAACVGAAALLFAYAVQLRPIVMDWNARAVMSRKAVTDLERIATEAPAGTLIVAGVSPRAWTYALPFAATPPFAHSDLTQRVSVISGSSLHCCAADQWDAYTRERLRSWLSRPRQSPVIAMHWNQRSGALTYLSDTNDPSLRTLIELLLQSDDSTALDANILRLTNDFVPYHAKAVRQ